MKDSFLDSKIGFGRAAQLRAPEFILSVLLLLANDFFLKEWLANGFTGKLSDFAGLFAFPFFWAALVPRWRVAIYLGTAVAFTLWKLPVSDGVIAGWNAISPFHVGRVIDASDLMALSILPLSYWRSTKPRQVSGRRWQTVGLAAISLFAFVATKEAAYIGSFDERFVFEGSRSELFVRLKENGIELNEGMIYGQGAPQAGWVLWVPLTFCLRGPAATYVTIVEKGPRTTVRLHEMEHYCSWYEEDEGKLLKAFTSRVAEPSGMVRQ